MSKLSRSPDRGTFQRDGYLKRCAEAGKEPSPAYLEWFDHIREQDLKWEADMDAHENDMEWDLRRSEKMCAKVRASETYAQNLYAAMCNMRFQKREVLPILKDEYWSCTWRSAGGIVADMIGRGDYIDWYCSGISNAQELDDDGSAVEDNYTRMKFVPEGTVTEEIENDLYDLGWVPSEWPDDKE
jgi:hypothetical protein